MFKGFRGLPKKAMKQNIKAKGNEALRIIDIIKSAMENFAAKINLKGLDGFTNIRGSHWGLVALTVQI